MIHIDYSLIHALGYIAPDEVSSIVEGDIATELFQCYLVFDANGIDLSWRVSIPMVDFARSMFISVRSLSDTDPEALFGSVEYSTRWRFRLSQALVLINRDDLPVVAACGRSELQKATAEFGVRVYDALLSALPAARENAFLSLWYPYDEMKRCMRRAVD